MFPFFFFPSYFNAIFFSFFFFLFYGNGSLGTISNSATDFTLILSFLFCDTVLLEQFQLATFLAAMSEHLFGRPLETGHASFGLINSVPKTVLQLGRVVTGSTKRVRLSLHAMFSVALRPETVGLLGTESPGRPPRLSHSS